VVIVYAGTVAYHLPKLQRLRQKSERGCSVPVFAELTGVSEDGVRRDLPQADLGQVEVDQWVSWLEKRGFRVLKRDGCPTDIVPCAHLVAHNQPRDKSHFHWVFRDADGDVHDPSPGNLAMAADDERMKNLSLYPERVLTLSVAGSP
jgi:hypothetical protein